MLFRKCTIAVKAIAISIGKNKPNAGNKIVPKPKPEKKVKIEANNARIGITRYSIGFFNYIPLIIPKKSVAFSAAPPISPPSTSGLEKISLALSGFTLPPYKIETFSATSVPYTF